MPQSRERSRFVPHDYRNWSKQRAAGDTPFNLLAHNNDHGNFELIYTSKATLDTTISTAWYPTQDYEIEYVRANVTGAPAGSALVWDVLIGGNSIFVNTAERIQIAASATLGRLTVPSIQGLPADSKLQVQGVTLSSATGPIVVTFALRRI